MDHGPVLSFGWCKDMIVLSVDAMKEEMRI